MWQTYYTPGSLEEALRLLADQHGTARLLAGGTDLLLELEHGQRPALRALIDVSRIPGLDKIVLDDAGWIHLGPRVTHNDCVASALIRERAFPLARACWEVGAPQIRNRGTIVGNLITASPANDSIPPLLALGARLTLASVRGRRAVPVQDFFTGVRKTVLAEDEMVTDVAFPALTRDWRGTFRKVGLRRAQAIALASVAVLLDLGGDGRVREARIALGAVAPTVVRAHAAEAELRGQVLAASAITAASQAAREAARPIDDIRASAAHRVRLIEVTTRRILEALAAGPADAEVPARPVLLRRPERREAASQDAETVEHQSGSIIVTTVNGQMYRVPVAPGKTLLQLLRDDLGLMGTKEGCAEGECGACTVLLDGAAVMACLVPAPRAHGAEIATIEGLAHGTDLHPLQRTFIEEGAVQCGYCSPGFLMSGSVLLEERPAPTRLEIQQGLAGNLCRCTGYYKIITAVEKAAAGLAGEPQAKVVV